MRVALNDGSAIPQLGLGLQHVGDDEAATLVREALEMGYRHLDTAQIYGNEAGVGRALRASGVARDEVWITTKLADGADPESGLDASLRRLGTGYVDLFLLHHPGAGAVDDVALWRALERLRADGRARSIGVSNFDRRGIERLIAATGTVPSVNQIRSNPRTPHRALTRYHRRRGIVTQAWGPLREGRLARHPAARRVAERLGATPAQVILRWHLQRGVVVFPKSARPQRLRENLAAADVTLSRRDMAAIDLMRRRP